MTTNEITFFDMSLNSEGYLKKYSSVWDKYPPIARRFSELCECNTGIRDARTVQNQSGTTSATTNKKHQIEKLGNLSYRLSCQLSFYAKDTDKVALHKAVNLPESDFTSGSDKSIIDKCQLMVKYAHQSLNDGQPYGITEHAIAQIEKQIAEVSDLPTEVNMITNEHKIATQQIKQYIAKSREVLEILDDAFEGLIDDDVFIDGWFDIRKIKGRHRAKKPLDMKREK